MQGLQKGSDGVGEGQGHSLGVAMKLETSVFHIYNVKYRNLSELAGAMGISVSQIYRVRQGRRYINEKFVIGTIRALPEYGLSDLFYLTPDGTANDRR